MKIRNVTVQILRDRSDQFFDFSATHVFVDEDGTVDDVILYLVVAGTHIDRIPRGILQGRTLMRRCIEFCGQTFFDQWTNKEAIFRFIELSILTS